MNLFISIFGGMLLTVILFGAARSLRLSNFWSAVISAALPSIAYMTYSIMDWPGLDVLTIHVIAFPTVALLLYQMGGSRNASGTRLHWAPKLLIGFFVILTMILGGFVYIAGNGVSPAIAQWLLPETHGKKIFTGFSGVVAHGEEAGKTIAHHRIMDEKMGRLGWQMEVIGLTTLHPGVASEVIVELKDKQLQSVADVDVSMGLGRPGRSMQDVFDLKPVKDGSYRTRVVLPAGGEWLAVLTLKHKGESIVFERALHGE